MSPQFTSKLLIEPFARLGYRACVLLRIPCVFSIAFYYRILSHDRRPIETIINIPRPLLTRIPGLGDAEEIPVALYVAGLQEVSNGYMQYLPPN